MNNRIISADGSVSPSSFIPFFFGFQCFPLLIQSIQILISRTPTHPAKLSDFTSRKTSF